MEEEDKEKSMEIDYIKINGGTALLRGNYRYHRHKTYTDGSTLWRCSTYNKSKCCGTVKISKDCIFIKSKDHSCELNGLSNEILKEKIKLREGVLNSDKPIEQLYDEKKKEFKNSGLNFVNGEYPRYESVKHFLQDARNKSAQVSKTVFRNVKEIEVPIKYHNLILADYYCEEGNKQTRIIAFCSKESRLIIPNIKEYFFDGTFYCCPKPFAQLCPNSLCHIHGDIGSGVETIKLRPLIFALMSDRTEKSYTILFNMIKSQLPEWSPHKVHTDYEKGAMNAILNVCPDITLRGCYYHWTRNIWKKGKSLRCTKTKSWRRIVALASALPLLPEDNIQQGMDYIKAEADNIPEAFIKYLESFWFKVHSPKIISVFGERHRTTNILEAFHSKINKLINKNTVTLMRLLHVLEQVHTLEMIPKKRRKDQIVNDDYIMSIQLQIVHKDISVGYGLEKLR